jgi:hypothetical protein
LEPAVESGVGPVPQGLPGAIFLAGKGQELCAPKGVRESPEI